MSAKKIVVILLALFSSPVIAQTKVGGKVVDTDGRAVPYATVVFKDSYEGTTTDEKGVFYLESDRTYQTLRISFVGFEPKEVPIERRVTYDLTVTLQEDTQQLEEIVVTTGKRSKKDDNPAIVILKKIWEHRRQNGLHLFDQYQYDKYEKIEFDLNNVDSSLFNLPLFRDFEFVGEYIDTSRVTGRTYLPVFINESYERVNGDNNYGAERSTLIGNKNSGFESNHAIIEFIKELYTPYDIYDNYLKFFDKAFVSPVSPPGVHAYNYVLTDSTYRDDKWCYNIQYYPRRKGEQTFQGNFWVSDTTWAVKEISLHASKSADVNWVRDIYIEQEFEVLNDSVFLLMRDHFMTDFSFSGKDEARGLYGKRTTFYDRYFFDIKRDKEFYRKDVNTYRAEVYNRPGEFWEEHRMETLDKEEQNIYRMIDTLQTRPQYLRAYKTVSTLASGYYELKGFDLGPIYSIFGYNEVEGVRTRVGGRTFFGQNDHWRVEGFLAYGFKDDKVKYGLSGKLLVDPLSRLIIFAGNRRDVEQTGAQLTTSSDVLGRSLASSSLLTVAPNDQLTNVNLTMAGFEVEPFKNMVVRMMGIYRTLRSASDELFNMDYFDDRNRVRSRVRQSEVSISLGFTPGRRTSGYGVERLVINNGRFPHFFIDYRYGLKDMFGGGDFGYRKLQLLYTQPWNVGGLGRLYTTMEAGKTFDPVPLALLSPIPGNQTWYSIYNTFSQLNFYEFVSDTYLTLHLLHDFGGRLFARVPGLRELNLREYLGFRAAYGEISEASKAINVSGIDYIAPENVYYEYSFGVGNIFKVFRIDFNFRGNYLDMPDARKFGVTGSFEFAF